jgi:hypothetical protein
LATNKKDPVFDGAADPTVLFYPVRREWLLFYTQRRASDLTLQNRSWFVYLFIELEYLETYEDKVKENNTLLEFALLYIHVLTFLDMLSVVLKMLT